MISFYTLGTPYEKEVERLVNSCNEFSIRREIEGLSSQGSWEKNCAMKPAFILEKLRQWKQPVLWVDADAAFLQPFDSQEFEGCTFSVRVNEFLPKHHESYVISNTIFANYDPVVIDLLEDWSKECQEALVQKEKTLECWDQAVLRDVLERKKLSFTPMPLKFSTIFDLDKLFISQKEIVIEHYQASRRLKFHELHQDHCCH